MRMDHLDEERKDSLGSRGNKRYLGGVSWIPPFYGPRRPLTSLVSLAHGLIQLTLNYESLIKWPPTS